MKKYKLFIVPLLILIAGTSFFLIFPRENNNGPDQPLDTQKPSQAPQTESQVYITVDFGNDETIHDSFEHQENQTAFGLLKSLAEMALFDMETQQYDFGIFVKSINGNESSVEMSWIYFVNGESGQVAADQHVLEPGDVVEWKYIKPE